MNIQEAVKAAMEQDKYIAQPESEYNTIFKPTNGPECIILMVIKDGKVIRSSRSGWQPQARDLIANDWKVIDFKEVKE